MWTELSDAVTRLSIAAATVLLLAMPVRADVFTDDDLLRLAALEKRLQQMVQDNAQALPLRADLLTDEDFKDLECSTQLLGQGVDFSVLFNSIQQIAGLSTKMVNSIDEKTVLEAFHQEAFRFLGYVEGMRKLYDENIKRPAWQSTCGKTATRTQQLLDLESDIAAVVREMDGRLIGLPNKR